jgi:hypothetical protein
MVRSRGSIVRRRHRTIHGFTGGFSSCGFKEGNPSRWGQSPRTRSCILVGTRCFWQVSDLALETAVRKYLAEAWAFALIHSDLKTRDEVTHSHDKRTEKSCERAMRMSSNSVSEATSRYLTVKCSLGIAPWNADKLPSAELSNKASVRLPFEKIGQCWWSL